MSIEKKLDAFKRSVELFKNSNFVLPNFPIDGFLKAWFNPFSGYDLNWIELEILHGTFSPISIKELRQNIIRNFPDENKKHFTTFYRKIKKMIDRKILIEEKDGKETLVKISENGAIELGKYYRYNMFKTFSISQTAWHARMSKIIRDRESCIHNKTILAAFNSVSVLNDYLVYCEREHKIISNVNANKEKFFLNFKDKDQEIVLVGNEIQIINVDSTSLFIKDNFIDLFISNDLFANLEPSQIPDFLYELQRVLKKNSKVYFSEIKEDVLNPLIENFSFFAQVMEYSKTIQAWDLRTPSFSTTELQELLCNYFTDIKIETFGVTNLISARKKE